MAYQLRANGHIASLQPYVDAERETYPAFLTNEDYYTDMLKPACAFDGAFYYLPIGPMSLPVYYNKTLFDEAGVAYPEEGWTWDDFREAASLIVMLPCIAIFFVFQKQFISGMVFSGMKG